jgi:Molybdopterin converting factor, small subunit
MGVIIRIPTALRQFTRNEAEVAVSAGTVRGALEALTVQYPELKKHLYKEDGALRSFVNVYVNEDNIRQRDGLDTELSEKDTLLLVPSIAGGRPEGGRRLA